jgi:hypothetical protein
MSSPIRDKGVDFGLVQSPPELLRKLSDDTAERVRESLRHTDTTLRHPDRKVSPAGGIALQLYKDTYVDVLDLLDVEKGRSLEQKAEETESYRGILSILSEKPI